jgi:hypothetical protein
MRFAPLLAVSLACACGGALTAAPVEDGGLPSERDAGAHAGTADASATSASTDAGELFIVVDSNDAGVFLACTGTTCGTSIFEQSEAGTCAISPGGGYGGVACPREDGGAECLQCLCSDTSNGRPGGAAHLGCFTTPLYCPADFKDGGTVGSDGAALGYSVSELWDDAGDDASADCTRYSRADLGCISASSEGSQPLGVPYAYECPADLYPSAPAGCVVYGTPGGAPPFMIVCCSD